MLTNFKKPSKSLHTPFLPTMLDSAMNAILLLPVLFVLLNIVEVCNGGITSSFVRKVYASEDMPLSAFPPPPGYNAPEQVEALP